jgi:hypothetical protein
MSVAFSKVNIFVEDLAKGEHNFTPTTGDTLKIALSSAANAPSASDDAVLADITTVSLTNLSGATPDVITISASAQSGGTYKLTLADLTLTATGAVGPFQYVILYNSSATTKTNPIIGFYNYGSEITLAATNTFLINMDDAAGALTIA